MGFLCFPLKIWGSAKQPFGPAKLRCTALSQSKWSNFFVYIITKDGVFVPDTAIFIHRKKFNGADFDHLLGNHFWTVNWCYPIYKARLYFIVFMKIRFIWTLLFYPYAQNLLVSNVIKNVVSERLERRVLTQEENVLVPDERTGFFFRALNLCQGRSSSG